MKYIIGILLAVFAVGGMLTATVEVPVISELTGYERTIFRGELLTPAVLVAIYWAIIMKGD